MDARGSAKETRQICGAGCAPTAAACARITMSEGDIHMSDIVGFVPFENVLVQFDLTW
jgi:hypothetical protein